MDASRQYLSPVYAAGSTAIILGCTHFPFLLEALESQAAVLSNGEWRPVFVDPSEAVVCESASILQASALCAGVMSAPGFSFAASGDPDEFRRFASALLGSPIPDVSQLVL
jgi:glutamate racemase